MTFTTQTNRSVLSTVERNEVDRTLGEIMQRTNAIALSMPEVDSHKIMKSLLNVKSIGFTPMCFILTPEFDNIHLVTYDCTGIIASSVVASVEECFGHEGDPPKIFRVVLLPKRFAQTLGPLLTSPTYPVAYPVAFIVGPDVDEMVQLICACKRFKSIRVLVAEAEAVVNDTEPTRLPCWLYHLPLERTSFTILDSDTQGTVVTRGDVNDKITAALVEMFRHYTDRGGVDLAAHNPEDVEDFLKTKVNTQTWDSPAL